MIIFPKGTEETELRVLLRGLEDMKREIYTIKRQNQIILLWKLKARKETENSINKTPYIVIASHISMNKWLALVYVTVLVLQSLVAS